MTFKQAVSSITAEEIRNGVVTFFVYVILFGSVGNTVGGRTFWLLGWMLGWSACCVVFNYFSARNS